VDIYILSDTPVEGAVRLPLIRQRFFFPPIDLGRYDYILFSSKNGVKALQAIAPEWKDIPAFAIGKATAKQVEALGGRVLNEKFAFYGEEFVQQIAASIPPASRLLYPRARQVVTPVAKLLRDRGFAVEDVVVYETECAECDKLEPPKKGAHIIFSSPSTIRCFFRCFAWDRSYKAYVIGRKSAAAMPKHIPYTLFEGQTLQQIVDNIRKNKV